MVASSCFSSQPKLRLMAYLPTALVAAVGRLDLRLDPRITIRKVSRHHWSWSGDGQYLFLGLLAAGCLWVISDFGWVIKSGLVVLYTLALTLPIASQFFFPATPIFSWLLFFFSSRFIPKDVRPHIWVSVLPALESILYGANISDILTRYTNPILDVLAWLPYGVVHFTVPFVVAFLLWVWGPPGSIKFWGKAFGYMNLVGVMIQVAFPTAPPWYELLYGTTPANYDMPGSPAGLARIDAIFHSNTYTTTFTNAPVPFGAFPSLHAGCATIEALFLSHFFPAGRIFYWAYVLVLYWSTMYLTHHYIVDCVAGASLAIATFYFFLNDEMRWAPNVAGAITATANGSASAGHDNVEDGRWSLDDIELGGVGDDVEGGGAGGAGGRKSRSGSSSSSKHVNGYAVHQERAGYESDSGSVKSGATGSRKVSMDASSALGIGRSKSPFSGIKGVWVNTHDRPSSSSSGAGLGGGNGPSSPAGEAGHGIVGGGSVAGAGGNGSGNGSGLGSPASASASAFVGVQDGLGVESRSRSPRPFVGSPGSAGAGM